MRRHFARIAVFAGAALIAACTAEESVEPPVVAAEEVATVSLKPAVTRELDPVSGRTLFVEKGCVICHAVNGVGGKAAPALDAEIGAPDADPLDFAARMWRGAPAMIELQSIELGYTIYLTADEIANLAAFAADREAQRSLTLDSLPETIRAGLLDERFWEMENWDDYLRGGREGDLPEDEIPDDPL
jgi:mono/diheme cytochrome c family protein